MSKQFTVEREKFEKGIKLIILIKIENKIDYDNQFPWENSNLFQFKDDCKKDIFKISEDEENFRIPPPDGVYTDFDLAKKSQLAFKLSELDNCLRDRSLKMIRRSDMNEYDFWRNYFYRVEIVVASYLEKAQNELYNKTLNENEKNEENDNKNENKEGEKEKVEKEGDKDKENENVIQNVIQNENENENVNTEDVDSEQSDVDLDELLKDAETDDDDNGDDNGEIDDIIEGIN